MKIPREDKALWDQLKDHGDIKKIADESGLHRHTIEPALNGEDCTMQVYVAIRDFYNARKIRLGINNINEKAA